MLISMKDMPGWQHAELGTTATVGNPPPFLLPQLGGRGVGVGSLRNTKETRVLRSHLSFPHTLRRPHHRRQIKGKGGLTSSSTPTGLKRCTHEKPLSYKDSDESPHSLTKAHTLEHVLPLTKGSPRKETWMRTASSTGKTARGNSTSIQHFVIKLG